MIPFVSLNVAGIKDNASKNNSKKQEDAGLISADASDTIEHLKSEHSENFGNILSLLRLLAVSESVKLLLRITWLADFMNSDIDRKQFTVFHQLAEHHQSCGYLGGLMSAAVGKEHSAFWRYILCSAMGHSWSDG